MDTYRTIWYEFFLGVAAVSQSGEGPTPDIGSMCGTATSVSTRGCLALQLKRLPMA